MSWEKGKLKFLVIHRDLYVELYRRSKLHAIMRMNVIEHSIGIHFYVLLFDAMN